MRQFLLYIKYLFRIKERVSLQKIRRNAIHIYITEKIRKELIYHEPAVVVVTIYVVKSKSYFRE